MVSSSVFISREEASPERQEDPSLDRFADTQILEDTQPPPAAVEVVDESPPKDPLEKLVEGALEKENVGNGTPPTGVNVGNGTPPTGAKADEPKPEDPKPKPKAKGAPKSRRQVIEALTVDDTQPEESPAPETQPHNAGE